MNGHTWQVKVVDSITVPGIIELEVQEYFDSITEDIAEAIEIDTRNIDAMFVLARADYSCYEFDKSTEMYDKIINTTKSQEKKEIALENKERVLNAQYSN